MTSQADKINEALDDAKLELSNAEREAVRLASNLKDPDDPAWMKVDQRINQAKARITRLEAMLTACWKAATETADAGLRAKRKAARDQTVKIARERIALAAWIDRTVADLGKLLDEWDAVGAECHRQAVLAKGLNPGGWADLSLDVAGSGARSFSYAMHCALFRAGIFKKRLRLPLEDLRDSPTGKQVSMEEAATVAAKHLESYLQVSESSALSS